MTAHITTSRLIFISLVAIAVAIASVIASSRISGSQAQPAAELGSVSRDLLESSHIALDSPGAAEASRHFAGRGAAEELALQKWPGARVSEISLFRVEDRLSDPPIACLCWVVVLQGGPPNYIAEPFNPAGSSGRFVPEASFRLVLVDAESGRYMYTVEGSQGSQVSQ